MKAETQGKLMVAMVISLLAFGFGTGTILVTCHYQDNNSSNTINVTKQGDFPYITNNRNYINNTPHQVPIQDNHMVEITLLTTVIIAIRPVTPEYFLKK